MQVIFYFTVSVFLGRDYSNDKTFQRRVFHFTYRAFQPGISFEVFSFLLLDPLESLLLVRVSSIVSLNSLNMIHISSLKSLSERTCRWLMLVDSSELIFLFTMHGWVLRCLSILTILVCGVFFLCCGGAPCLRAM